jgi:amino acid permease
MMDLKMKKFITLNYIIILYIVLYIVIFIALYFIGLIDKESKITFTSFGSGLGGLIVIIGLYFFYQRLEKQQKQIDIQINQRVDCTSLKTAF